MRRYVYSAVLILFVTACTATKVQAPTMTFAPTLGPTAILAPTFSDPVAPTFMSSPRAIATSTYAATTKTTLTVTPSATAMPTRRPTNTFLPTSLPTSIHPTTTSTPTCTATSVPLPTVSLSPTVPPATPTSEVVFLPPPGREFATLEDFWNGSAEWLLEEPDTGLPVGESDTVYRGGNEFWSYLHASHQSASVVDQCGDPVPFPGCTTLWKSYDGGRHFVLEEPICLFPCATCPCDNRRDHIGQQQYPRVAFVPDQAYLVYEFGAFVYLRTSTDGVRWSTSALVPGTGVWTLDYDSCSEYASVGEHPHIYSELEYDCLIGAPPGVYVEGDQLYVFVGLGRAPGHMGCYTGNRYNGAWGLGPCRSNPLFGADLGYGPVEVLDAEANPYFDFRTISSADIVRVGERYYMLYEGVRGPSSPTVVDDQFGLGVARSATAAIDGPWEKYPGNPIIMDLPGNVGVGHADIVLVGGATYLYTATPAYVRGRYVLVRR